MKFREVPISPEAREGGETPETKVVLHFFRHEKKGPKEEDDRNTPLSEEGSKDALARGVQEPAQMEVALAGGSPRYRSAHTALDRMVANEGAVTPDMTYDEAKAVVEKDMKVGSKVMLLPELNFEHTGTEGFKDKFIGSINEGRYLEFLYEDSDNVVVEEGDMESLSISRMAGNYASLIAREMRAGNAFNKVVQEKPDKYADSGNQMERYFGTHAGVTESFVMKVLEKVYGGDRVKEFIDKTRDPKGKDAGFDYQQGITLTIINNGEGRSMVMAGLPDMDDVKITPEVLSEIIEDAENLDNTIKTAKAA